MNRKFHILGDTPPKEIIEDAVELCFVRADMGWLPPPTGYGDIGADSWLGYVSLLRGARRSFQGIDERASLALRILDDYSELA